MFGDATSKSPLGVFKNYHLKIGECIIQTDLTVMEMEEEKDLPLLLGTPFLSTVGASIDFHKQEVILHKVNSLVSYRLQPRGSDFCATIDSTTLNSKTHEATKIVKERVDKEPRVGKDKVERGPRIEKPRLERARVEKPRSDRPRADRLVQAPCVLDEESLQALFNEPLGRALKEGEDVASKARPEEPELDRAEDRAQESADLGEPECYYFEEYEAPRMNPSVVAATRGLDFSKSSTNGKGKPLKDAKVHGQDGVVTPHHPKEAPCPRASQSLFIRAKGRRRQHAEKEEEFQGQTLQLDHRTRSSPNRGNSTRRAGLGGAH
ncbi:unnamed protein product [Microthlaspi erraticum]|uniref:Aspartic peptidase DDI1-type domain-containing protein n=1 Tax=Microthlaspi erraticum TaxID=1685480 RepID=A0A6D2IFT1_9BRAS|nr:unnamed protein product [Microthlaspi erraticum]